MEVISQQTVKPIRDQVLIEKLEEYDNTRKFGSIWIPENTNLNIRESKVGRVVASGRGRVTKRRILIPNTVEIGTMVYYTRYGKEVIEDEDFNKFILCPDEGVLAYLHVNTKTGDPVSIQPRLDRLWVSEIKENEYEGNLIIPDSAVYVPGKGDIGQDRYRRWKVLEAGPGRTTLNTGELVPMVVKKGDIVVASADSGVRISWNHKGVRRMFMLVKESECVAYERA